MSIIDDFTSIARERERLRTDPPEPWHMPVSIRRCDKCGAEIAACQCDAPRCPCGMTAAGECYCF
jgi:hypothetical protein